MYTQATLRSNCHFGLQKQTSYVNTERLISAHKNHTYIQYYEAVPPSVSQDNSLQVAVTRRRPLAGVILVVALVAGQLHSNLKQ